MLEITDTVEVPEGHEEVATVGSYKFTQYDGARWLVGFQSCINLHTSSISATCIMPVDARFRFSDGPPLEHRLDAGVAYFMVDVNPRAGYFLFASLDDALTFIVILVQNKANALNRQTPEVGGAE